MTPTMDRTRLDEVAAVEIERWRERVERFARELHANPETAFEEHRSAAAAAGLLAEAGFTVQRPVAGLETAFVAEYGSGTLTVAICIEYDALPGVGHACGHNLIAGASVATALALAPHADALGITIRAIGTPAEEHGGGKSLLLDRGVFDGAGSGRVPSAREHRRVPGRDRDDDAPRHALRVGVPSAGDGDREAADFVGPAGVVAEHLGDLRGLGARVAQRLAVRRLR